MCVLPQRVQLLVCVVLWLRARGNHDSNGPCFTNILLKEVACEKDVVGLNICGADEQAVAMVFSHGDMFTTSITWFIWCMILFLLNILIEDVGVPTKLASRKKKNISQGRIEGVNIRDALQRFTMEAIQDNVLRTSYLIPITRKNDSNLPDRGIRGLIATPITSSSKAKGNAALLLWRDGMGQLKCLPVEANSRM
jgi:hypothetical protein